MHHKAFGTSRTRTRIANWCGARNYARARGVLQIRAYRTCMTSVYHRRRTRNATLESSCHSKRQDPPSQRHNASRFSAHRRPASRRRSTHSRTSPPAAPTWPREGAHNARQSTVCANTALCMQRTCARPSNQRGPAEAASASAGSAAPPPLACGAPLVALQTTSTRTTLYTKAKTNATHWSTALQTTSMCACMQYAMYCPRCLRHAPLPPRPGRSCACGVVHSACVLVNLPYVRAQQPAQPACSTLA